MQDPEVREQQRPVAYSQSWRQQEALAMQLLLLARGMWRYRWLSVMTAWVVCVLGWVIVYRMPNLYQASARVFVDTDSVVQQVVRGLTVQPNAMAEVNMLARALLNRPQLERVARVTGLAASVDSPQQLDALLTGLGERIDLRAEADNIYVITYEDSNAVRSAEVVNALLDTFIEDYLGQQQTESTAAGAFLEEQIADYERRLAEAEQRLADFRRENVGLLPGQAGDYYERLDNAIAAVATTRSDLELALQRRAEFQKQLEGEEPLFGLGPLAQEEISGSASDATLARYRAELDTLLLRFTPQHPDVIALKELIGRLEADRATQAPVTTAAATELRSVPNPLDVNPVYQRMRIGLSETAVEIAALRSRLNEQTNAVNELKALVDTIPEVESHLTALNRDYRVLTQQFEALLQRRESVNITDAVEQTGNNIDFRVIEPSTPPFIPIAPDRPLFMSAVLVLAIAIGLGLGFVVDRLHPVVYSRRDLFEIADLPVFGTISAAVSARDRALERGQTLRFAAACGGLLVALFVAILLFSELGTEILQTPLQGNL